MLLCATIGIGFVAEFLTHFLFPLERSRIDMRRQRAFVERLKSKQSRGRGESQWHETETLTWKERLICLAVRLRNNSADDDPNLDVPLKMLIPGLPLMALYVVGRITVFVLDGIAFRAQPGGVYESVDWSMYLPHIG